jgi:hypothetical protein
MKEMRRAEDDLSDALSECAALEASFLRVASEALGTEAWEAREALAKLVAQSALLKQLVARGEGLNHVPLPFHSYCGGPKLKLFPHVAVLPRHAINTNRGDVRQRTPVSSSGDDEEGGDLTYRCDFVFHAAGRPVLMRDGNDAHHPPRYCSSKEEALRATRN